MTRRLLDYNPLTGERVWFDYTPHTEEMVLTHEQDVENILAEAADLRAREGYSQRGIKNDMWHYARVPNTIIVEMRQKHGVDLFDPKQGKEVFRLLNTEYSRLKTTNKTHNVR